MVGTALGFWGAWVSVSHVHLCMAALAISLYLTSSSGGVFRQFHFEKTPTSMVYRRGCYVFLALSLDTSSGAGK